MMLVRHRRRLHLMHGMIGPCQDLDPRQVPLQEMVKINYLYIAVGSLWTDANIRVRTAIHDLRRRGL